MAPKPDRIADVENQGRVAPSASSRPILVRDHAAPANDPMMVAADTTEPEGAQAKITNRSAKVISPPSAQPELASEPATPPETPPKDTKTQAEPAAEPVPAETSVPTPPETPPDATDELNEPERDAEAASSAAEAKATATETARSQKLEQLIAAGTYAVPINAVQQRRSRMYVALLCTVAVLLALLLLDTLLDAGIVTLPVSVPHTHFFSVIQL